MIINNHRLTGENIQHLSCTKNKINFKVDFPDSIIIHYTASTDLETTCKHLCKNNIPASAHLVIDRDGKSIRQLVPFNKIAWHAGESEYQGRELYNKYSIGIEIINAGKLESKNGKYYTWYNEEIPANEVYENENGLWHRYHGGEIQTVYQVVQVICEKYAIREILGHSEIAPGRKEDPGDAFPLEELRRDMKNFLI